MRFDPRRRLHRRLPGDGTAAAMEEQDTASGRTLRLHLGEERPLPVDPVPARDQAALFSVEQRPTRKLAEAGPNAPQLVRLIRYPYRQETGRFTRVALHATAGEGAVRSGQRAPFGHPMREALAEMGFASGRVGSAKPNLRRPTPFTVRPSATTPIPALSGDSERGE